MHLSDGLLSWPALASGFAAAGGLFVWSSYKVKDDEIPRIALFTAAFFVASLVHLRMPVGSVHLMFNGLIGVVLGRRALMAFPVGLALQAALLSHGGFTVLGVNVCLFGVPALICWQGYEWLCRWRPQWRAVIGGVLGGFAVLLTGAFWMLLLLWTGEEFRYLAEFAFLAHLPVAIIEGVVTGFVISYLYRVQPSLVARVEQ
ncbi:MAG: CbiM family transporter [Candidatus Hinthialibacter antarcticus]|nr:CbiM family transporter [Candidatus Hinthialibacter antarcticus]